MAAQYSYGHRLQPTEYQDRRKSTSDYDDRQLLATGVYGPPKHSLSVTESVPQRALTVSRELDRYYRTPSPAFSSTRTPSQKYIQYVKELHEPRAPPPRYQPAFPTKQAKCGYDVQQPRSPPPQYQPEFPNTEQETCCQPPQQTPNKQSHHQPAHSEQPRRDRKEHRPLTIHSKSEPKVTKPPFQDHVNAIHRPPVVQSQSEPAMIQHHLHQVNPHPRPSPSGPVPSRYGEQPQKQPQYQQQNHVTSPSPPRPQSFHAQFVSLPMFTLFTHHEAVAQQVWEEKYRQLKAAEEKELPTSTKAALFMVDCMSGGNFIGLEELAKGINKLDQTAAKMHCKELATVVLTRWAWTGKRANGKIGTLLVDVLEYRWKLNMTPVYIKCSATETVKIILCGKKEAKIKPGKAYSKEANLTHVEKVAMVDADGRVESMEAIVQGQCGCSATEWNEMKQRFEYGWHVPRIGR